MAGSAFGYVSTGGGASLEYLEGKTSMIHSLASPTVNRAVSSGSLPGPSRHCQFTPGRREVVGSKVRHPRTFVVTALKIGQPCQRQVGLAADALDGHSATLSGRWC
jgi:hypothetical protein